MVFMNVQRQTYYYYLFLKFLYFIYKIYNFLDKTMLSIAE